ncbi:hypothetical protein MPEAHAMD_2431 [Methylobacterium frigidaeris]|uniref:Lysine transporter LysE n=1 Tax=Methylobacterium frigidaeris TaxID=2038277 RepID=A0AA37HAU0_9HYPH|nr:hypothetical protein MPEAHAMD_2431 [Methylobacterium frigidaeris]
MIAAIGLQSTLISGGNAWLFSNSRMARVYPRLRRWFEGAVAVLFAVAGRRVLTSRLTT